MLVVRKRGWRVWVRVRRVRLVVLLVMSWLRKVGSVDAIVVFVGLLMLMRRLSEYDQKKSFWCGNSPGTYPYSSSW